MIRDADNDRDSDSLCMEIWGTFEILFDELKQSIILNIDQLIELIQDTPEDSWSRNNKKKKMINKLIALKQIISVNNYEHAYDKLLHDIKPKLTGLKCDENGNIWGNGVFYNPWITDIVLQGSFCLRCDEILNGLSTLIESTIKRQIKNH